MAMGAFDTEHSRFGSSSSATATVVLSLGRQAAGAVIQLSEEARRSLLRVIESPGEPSTTRRAASACAAPAIMLGTKSRCPGASSSVTAWRLVSKRAVATSTVTPRARSSGLVCGSRDTVCQKLQGEKTYRSALHHLLGIACFTACGAMLLLCGRCKVEKGPGPKFSANAAKGHLSSRSQAQEKEALPARAASVCCLCTCARYDRICRNTVVELTMCTIATRLKTSD